MLLCLVSWEAYHAAALMAALEITTDHTPVLTLCVLLPSCHLLQETTSPPHPDKPAADARGVRNPTPTVTATPNGRKRDRELLDSGTLGDQHADAKGGLCTW